MSLTALGTGTVQFVVSSVVLTPAHTQPPLWSPENPNPEPIEVPDKAVATLTPINEPDSPTVASGGFTITTETLDAFSVGDKYDVTIAAAAPAATRKGK